MMKSVRLLKHIFNMKIFGKEATMEQTMRNIKIYCSKNKKKDDIAKRNDSNIMG